jgi:hypothetical protein
MRLCVSANICLSFGSYSRPRTTMELEEVGIVLHERHAGRLIGINGV